LKKKILIVFGTRPEAIKMAPLVFEFKKHLNNFSTFVCVTGQHSQMLDQVLSLFQIVPDYNLQVMKPDQDLFVITTSILSGIKDVLDKVSPDFVFVQGDTTTSFAAALSAFYRKIPVAHVEAGLRTYDIYHPWPEEANRSLISRITTWHFAPTSIAKLNLISENIREDHIVLTGNTGVDALHLMINQLKIQSREKVNLAEIILKKGYNLSRLNSIRKLILVTSHRRENMGNRLKNICQSILNLSNAHPDVDFVYPVHLNPNVLNQVFEILGRKSLSENVFLINPLEYLPFVYLMSKSFLILTDSGGIQEEAPSLGIPVLVMRDTTERLEAVEAGTAIMVGTDNELIEHTVNELLNNKVLYKSMSSNANPFGDGKAAERIVSFIQSL